MFDQPPEPPPEPPPVKEWVALASDDFKFLKFDEAGAASELPRREAPPIDFHELQIVPGGTAYVPDYTGVGSGEEPPPWNSPLPHADRLVHGDRLIIKWTSGRP